MFGKSTLVFCSFSGGLCGGLSFLFLAGLEGAGHIAGEIAGGAKLFAVIDVAVNGGNGFAYLDGGSDAADQGTAGRAVEVEGAVQGHSGHSGGEAQSAADHIGQSEQAATMDSAVMVEHFGSDSQFTFADLFSQLGDPPELLCSSNKYTHKKPFLRWM